MENYSEGLATGMALTQGNGYNNGGLGLGGGFLADIIGLVAVAGIFGLGNFGGNGAFGGRGGACATQADVRAAVDQQTLISKLDQQTYGLADSTYALNNTINGNFRTLDNAICSIGHQISDCCCATQRSIDGVNYNLATHFGALNNTLCGLSRDIIDNQNANYRAIHEELVANKIEAKNERIAELTMQLNRADLRASQEAQNAYLLSELKGYPKPAYIVPNPNCCYNYGVQGVGYGNGCSCTSL